MLEIVVCEDNLEYRELITKNINNFIDENKINGKIVLECESPKRVSNFIKNYTPNVFFLDIELNADQTGYDLAMSIKDSVQNPYIVFISQHTDFVFKSFKVKAFDFLPKPVSKKDIENVLNRIYSDYINDFIHSNTEYFTIKLGPKIYNIPKNEIKLIEKSGNKCVFHSNNNTIYCYETLDAVYEKLESDNFIRCHKGYIVNKSYIKEVNIVEMEISLTNGQKCYIGGKYKKDIILRLNTH